MKTSIVKAYSGKEYLTISEISNLCGVTVAALKHYEKIGLLYPKFIDPYSRYRYYSIQQYEKIETIRELRELGVPLSDIKEFIDNRNIEKSIDFFKKQHEDLTAKIKKLTAIKKHIKEQIDLMEKCNKGSPFIIREENLGQRSLLFHEKYNVQRINEVDTCYACLNIERLLGSEKKVSTMARGRMGFLISKQDIENGQLMNSRPFIFIDRKETTKENRKHLETLNGGLHICLMYRGDIAGRSIYLEKMLKYLDQHNYTIAGEVVQIVLTDDTVSDIPEESVFDIQIPVKKCLPLSP